MQSNHYTKERKARERRIQSIGEGEKAAEFLIDRGRGLEKHVITTTGIIIIYNAASLLLITKLIARPGQIKRYYSDGNYPAEIVDIAIQHEKQKLIR